jgi:hypothetical protein
VRTMKATECIAVLALVISAMACAPVLASAGERGGNREDAKEGGEGVDTQFIFGFTKGADVGERGEKEIEWETAGRFGKENGTYTALESQIRAEYTPDDRVRIEMGIPIAYHGIGGVTGFEDRQRGAYDGMDFELRYRLFDRAHAPFALALSAEPHWTRADDITGEPAANYRSEFALAADKELIKDRIFGAFNLLYDPEATRSRLTGIWEQQSRLGFSLSVTDQLHQGAFFGAEMRYLRQYDGIGLNSLIGEALFLGPTFYVTLSKQFAISGAWNFQVGGHAAGAPGALDLRNFEHHQAFVRLMYTF